MYSYPIRKEPDCFPGGGEDLKTPVGIIKGNLCQHPGCQKEGVPCYPASGDGESIVFYCSDHCRVHGFCSSCGLYWAGLEFSGSGNGSFVNWQECLKAEIGEDEKDLDGRILDKSSDHEERLKYYRGEIPEEVSHCDPFPEKISLR